MDLLDGSLVNDLGDPEISESIMNLDGSSVDKSNTLKIKTNLKGSLVENLSKLKTKPDGSLVDKSDKSIVLVSETKLNSPIRKVDSLESRNMPVSNFNRLT